MQLVLPGTVQVSLDKQIKGICQVGYDAFIELEKGTSKKERFIVATTNALDAAKERGRKKGEG